MGQYLFNTGTSKEDQGGAGDEEEGDSVIELTFRPYAL